LCKPHHMNPFVYFGSVVMVSPFIGYWVYRYLRLPTISLLLYSAVLLALTYGVVFLSGNRLIGEEGDYMLFSFLFLFFNIALFQILKLKRQVWILSVFV
jgi:hypothetical protein